MLRPLYLVTENLLGFIRQNPKEAIRVAELYGIECRASAIDIILGKPIIREEGPIQVYWGQCNTKIDIRDFEIETDDPAAGDCILTGVFGGNHHLLVINDTGDKQYVQVLLNIILQNWENGHVRESCNRHMFYCTAIGCEARKIENLTQERERENT